MQLCTARHAWFAGAPGEHRVMDCAPHSHKKPFMHQQGCEAPFRSGGSEAASVLQHHRSFPCNPASCTVADHRNETRAPKTSPNKVALLCCGLAGTCCHVMIPVCVNGWDILLGELLSSLQSLLFTFKLCLDCYSNSSRNMRPNVCFGKRT